MDTFSEAEVSFEARNWAAARENFQKGHKDKKAMTEFLAHQTTAQQARSSCLEAQARANSQYNPGLGGVLSKIETFMKVGDLAMKSAPESVGLAWTGIRLCLHSVEDDFATFNLFSGAAADIIGILISCRVYGKMYGGHKGPEDFQELHKKVVEYIPDIYKDILDFSYAMNKHMGRNTGLRIIRGMLTSASAKFQPMVDGIRSSEQTMSAYATKATNQLSIHYQEVGLHNQGVGLQMQQTMLADLSVIRDTLESSMEVNKIYLNQIRQLEEDKKSMKKKTPLDKAKELFEDNVKRLEPTNAAETALEKHRSRRQKGTCNWIFELEEYKTWRSSTESSLLWVSGVGGLGKSILMSTVIDGLQEAFKEDKSCSAQYFFCSAGEDSTRLVARIKKQLLHQLYQMALSDESSDILDRSNDVISNFLGKKDSADSKPGSQQKKSEKATGFEDAYPSLAKILGKKIILIIDALDECTDRRDAGILKTLQETLSVSELPLKVMVCSRPEPDIVDNLVSKAAIKVEDHNGPDIEKAAKAKLEELPGLSSEERALACRSIVEKAKGLFRCVDPAIEFLKKPWRRPLEKRLAELPDGLDNSYQQILRQTDPDYLELLKVGLTWSIFAQIKPTVAEIMDEYSYAYAEGIEGSDDNPYDTMDIHLIGDQIRRAGSGTFLEVAGNEVSVRHTTVKEFFLKVNPAAEVLNGYCLDELCTKCQSEKSADQPLTMSEKEGQLRMATTIFKHLNSPLFQRRYLRKEIEDIKSAELVDAVSKQRDSAVHEDSKSGEQNTTAADTNGYANGGTHVASLVNRSLLGEDLNGINTSSTTLEEASALGEGKASLVVTNDNDAIYENNAPSDGDNSEHLPEDPRTSVVEGKVKADGEDETTEIPQQPDKEPFPDDDDERGRRDSEILEEPVVDSAQAPVRPKRYELSYWHDHLASAEKLWTTEEREKSDEWKELWKLVVQFLCESPDVFQVWQQHYMELDMNYEAENTLLSPLQVAAAYGIPGLVKILLERGEPAAAELEDGRSALWFAAASCEIEIITLLLEGGASPNARKDFPPPFHALLWWNPNLDFVNLMLEHGADCNVIDQWGFNVMHWFAMFGSDVEVLKVLLKAHGDINVPDTWGETPLHKLMYNAQSLSLDLLRAFLDNGADVNRDDKDSQRPLYEVCTVGNTEAAKILLDQGANIHDDDLYGQTGVHIAAAFGHLDIVKLLTERGANLDLGDKHGRTPLFLACSGGNLETARFLLTTMRGKGHNSVNTAMNDGRTPLSKAAGRGHVEVVKMLLEETDAASAVNVQETAQRRTALHWAAYNGRTEVVDILLRQGADATIEDSKSQTALALCGQGWAKDKSGDRIQIIIALVDHDRETAAKDTELMATAAIKGSTKVIERLLDARAHPSKQDEHGWTPLQLAKQYGNTDAATLLAKRGAEVGSRPSRWNTDNEKIKVSEDGCELEYVKEPCNDGSGVQILANHPIPAGIECFYYEIEIKKDVGDDTKIFNAIGFSTQPARLDRMPGWYNATAPSFAYHGDDGRLYANSNQSLKDYAGSYGKGDTIGCGVIYNDSVEGTIFYTRNGQPQGPAFEKDVKGRLYPVIGMTEPAAVAVNFGSDVESRPFKWELGNSGKYDIDAVKKKKEEEPVTVQVPIEFGISKPPI